MKVFITFILIFFSIACLANDSALYNKRLQKIEQLHAWLSKRPYISIDIKNVDTNHISWRSYDTVINTFFDRKYLDSLFASRAGSDAIFAPSAKFQILKLLISKFHELIQKQCFQDLKFKKVDLDNTIVQFFEFEGKELIWNAFTFADKGVHLVDMPVYGFSTGDLGQFMLTYEKLKPCDVQIQVPQNVKVTILSTMLAQTGIGEWGFSALVEVDSAKILFDAGGRKTTVLENAKELNIDLSKVPALVLSHWHDDHTAGWIPLRTEVKSIQPNALSQTHVANGFFDIRYPNNSKEPKSRLQDSTDYVLSGGKIILHQGFDQILPGIYLTGNVPRIFEEKNYYKANKRLDKKIQLQEDNIPDDMSLIISTNKGLILISGCGHSGIVNTMAYINKNLPGKKILAVIGGFHLLNANDGQIKWTAEQLKKSGVQYFMGAHCTGIEPVYQIRNLVQGKRGNFVVGSVGDRFELSKGIITGDLNK